MKDDGSVMLSLIFIGFIVGVFISLLINAFSDKSFGRTQKKMDSFNYACMSMKSKPDKFDEYSVTCENGIIIEIDMLNK